MRWPWRLLALLLHATLIFAIFGPSSSNAQATSRGTNAGASTWVELTDGALFNELANGEPWLVVLHSPAYDPSNAQAHTSLPTMREQTAACSSEGSSALAVTASESGPVETCICMRACATLCTAVHGMTYELPSAHQTLPSAHCLLMLPARPAAVGARKSSCK